MSLKSIGVKNKLGEKAEESIAVVPQKQNKKARKKNRIRVRKEKKEEIESHWDLLPDLLLEKIFSFLTIYERYKASLVCKRWFAAFYLPKVWSTLQMGDHTLVRRKFNYYMGWEHVLDHMRTQNCLATVGRNIRTLVFEPKYTFQNLYEFIVILTYYAERNQLERNGKVVYHTQFNGKHFEVLVDVRGGGKGIGSRISTLKFTFPCNMAHSGRAGEEYIFGTGGTLLEAFKRLMGSLGTSLRNIQLTDLLLDNFEALRLLDEVCYTGCETLETLELVNITKFPCQLLHPGTFVKLQVLVISPQSIGVDLLQLLGSLKSLKHLHLIQNRYTTEGLTSVSWSSWRQCSKDNPSLNVHLEAQNIREREVLWQQCAPVRSILYKSAYIKVTSNSVLTAVDQYRNELEVYGHMGLPRFHRSKSFHDRADSLLLLLIRQCLNIHTLIIRERISTATVLLIAYTGQNLKYLHIRRNAVILRCDWPRSPEWSETFYSWLRNSSLSYDTTEREVSQILGYRWTMLSDRQFQLTTINLHQTPYRQSTRSNYHTYVPPPLPTPTNNEQNENKANIFKKIKKIKIKRSEQQREL